MRRYKFVRNFFWFLFRFVENFHVPIKKIQNVWNTFWNLNYLFCRRKAGWWDSRSRTVTRECSRQTSLDQSNQQQQHQQQQLWILRTTTTRQQQLWMNLNIFSCHIKLILIFKSEIRTKSRVKKYWLSQEPERWHRKAKLKRKIFSEEQFKLNSDLNVSSCVFLKFVSLLFFREQFF